MEHEPLAGTHIDRAVDDALAIARQHGEVVRVRFNGIELDVTPDAEGKTFVQKYHEEMDRLAEEHRRSPEGIAQAARSETEMLMLQERANLLMEDLELIYRHSYMDSMPFMLLRWLWHIGPASDRVGVTIDTDRIVHIFGQMGYVPGEYVGDHRVGDEIWPGITTRYLVGQCLSMLEGPPHAIHGILYGDWIPRHLRGESLKSAGHQEHDENQQQDSSEA